MGQQFRHSRLGSFLLPDYLGHPSWLWQRTSSTWAGMASGLVRTLTYTWPLHLATQVSHNKAGGGFRRRGGGGLWRSSIERGQGGSLLAFPSPSIIFFWLKWSQSAQNQQEETWTPLFARKSAKEVWSHVLFYFVLFYFILFFRTAPLAYGSSQDKGRIGELQLPVYATATATPDPSHICNLCHNFRQCRIFNPRSEARD